MSVGGRTYRLCAARRTYKSNGTPTFQGSLVDGGCNGGLAGDDCIILETHSFGKVDIVGVGDNLIKDVALCTAAGLIETSEGPIIGIMHNYAALGKGGSIHSPLQMQDFGVLIDDKAKTQKRMDGEFGIQKVRIVSNGTVFDIPLVLNGGLPYFKMVPPTQEQLADETIPRVTLTSDMPWDPSKYDEELEPIQNEADDEGTPYEAPINPDYDTPLPGDANADRDAHFADLQRVRGECAEMNVQDDEFEDLDGIDVPMLDAVFNAVPNIIEVMASACCTTYHAKKTWLEHKYGKSIEQLRPHFAFASADRITATVEASTQLYRASQWSKKIKRHFKSRFPGVNVDRINETVCSDTAYMEPKGADGITGHGGAMGFQLFVGHDTRHLAVYMVQTDAAYPRCLGEYIRSHGAPKKMFCNNAKAETSEATKEIYRNYGISDANSEPYYQNQNAAEREIQDVKKDVEQLMNITSTPDNMWPLCVEFVCLVKNHTARKSLNDRTPIEKRTGHTPDISKFLAFRWWEPVYFLNKYGIECLGRWAGVAEHVGDELTYIVVSEKTGRHGTYMGTAEHHCSRRQDVVCPLRRCQRSARHERMEVSQEGGEEHSQGL
jgi:hypothetical protein